MNEEKKKISIMDEIFTIRMIVSLETSPQSNKYRQIRFTQEQFKKHTQFMAQTFKCDCGKKSCMGANFDCSDEVYSLPENVQDYKSKPLYETKT